MPELREVETVRRQLAERLNGARIVDVSLRTPHLIRSDATMFASDIVGKTIINVLRRAKTAGASDSRCVASLARSTRNEYE